MGKERLMTVGEAAKAAGVSVRTLRHYDAIGLLRPVATSDCGYRLYDAAAMRRLEEILFLRELDFPLEEIAQMLDVPAHAREAAMRRQADVLRAKRKRLDLLIERLESCARGTTEPRFEVFDMKEIEKKRQAYAEEAKNRWGDTPAYAQSERRAAKRTKDDEARMAAEMDELLDGFAALRDCADDDPRLIEQAKAWQAHITRWHYDCTVEILAGLGMMYTADERFTQNIDRHGEGTAACLSRAIEAYCAAKRQ